MVDTLIYVLGVLAFFVVVGCVSRWLEYRAEAAQFVEPPFVALRSPSRTNAFDRRIEAALRDAERGFRLCGKCLFTNRIRAECCVLCGFKLTDGAQPSYDNTQLTLRQRRVRSRKDWIRRVTEEDKVVWASSIERKATIFPYYMLRIKAAVPLGSNDAQVTTGSVGGILDPIASSEEVVDTVAVPIDKPIKPTLDDILAELRNYVSGTEVELLPVTNGHAAPMHVQLETTKLSNAEWKDAVLKAATDFPTKLAQFVTMTSTVFLSAALNDDGTIHSTRLNILRDSLIATSVEAMATLTHDQVRAAIRVDFVGEQGIDAGGVYREWFVLLNERIVAPEAGIFTCVDEANVLYYLNPHSREILGDNHLVHFLAAGRLVGRALLEANVTGFHLALPLLKIILGLPIGFPDLEHFDPTLYSNLQWLLTTDNVEEIGLDFTVVEKLPDGSTHVVELIPNGSTTEVTNHNKHDFVNRKLQYVLVERVHDQLVAFLKGLYDILPPQLLVLLDPEELDHLIAGSDDINVDDWERNSQLSGNLLMHPALPNFWRVVRELSLDERRRLLQFATGSTRVPPGGFATLTSFDGRQCAFTLHGMAVWRSMGYIRSHACFNRLDLPLHFDLASMRRAVHAAIAVDAVGFTAS